VSDYTFISYETADAVPAHELCAQLEAARLVCWIAPRDIPRSTCAPCCGSTGRK
jgi:hypothetical protein